MLQKSRLTSTQKAAKHGHGKECLVRCLCLRLDGVSHLHINFSKVHGDKLLHLLQGDVVHGDQQPGRLLAFSGGVGRSMKAGLLRQPASFHDRKITGLCAHLATLVHSLVPLLNDLPGILYREIGIFGQSRNRTRAGCVHVPVDSILGKYCTLAGECHGETDLHHVIVVFCTCAVLVDLHLDLPTKVLTPLPRSLDAGIVQLHQ
mmetsp:Transcript_48350/g.113145  ORF Transcript_48350/g.113145 Transcript_48350/m.113145 type:complete len:204 (+) Transcript_48350:1271-1882(+)